MHRGALDFTDAVQVRRSAGVAGMPDIRPRSSHVSQCLLSCPLGACVQMSTLLSLAFVSGDDDGGDVQGGGGGGGGGRGAGTSLSVSQLAAYRFKLLAALQWRAAQLGQRWVHVTATSAAGDLAGCATLTPGVSVTGAEAHLSGRDQADCVAATVSNMAVAEAHRRQGLGRLLLAACEQAALQYAPPATLMALAVFRHNDVARALYESSGYAEDESWVDPRWAASAERGRVDIARRLLLLKPLAAPP